MTKASRSLATEGCWLSSRATCSNADSSSRWPHTPATSVTPQRVKAAGTRATGLPVGPEEPAVAVAELDAAHDTFERIGARRLTDEAAALLRMLGGPAETGPKLEAELTRREDGVTSRGRAPWWNRPRARGDCLMTSSKGLRRSKLASTDVGRTRTMRTDR